MKISGELDRKSVLSSARVTTSTIPVFPPEAVKCVGNLPPIVSLTFYNFPDFVF